MSHGRVDVPQMEPCENFQDYVLSQLDQLRHNVEQRCDPATASRFSNRASSGPFTLTNGGTSGTLPEFSEHSKFEYPNEANSTKKITPPRGPPLTSAHRSNCHYQSPKPCPEYNDMASGEITDTHEHGMLASKAQSRSSNNLSQESQHSGRESTSRPSQVCSEPVLIFRMHQYASEKVGNMTVQEALQRRASVTEYQRRSSQASENERFSITRAANLPAVHELKQASADETDEDHRLSLVTPKQEENVKTKVSFMNSDSGREWEEKDSGGPKPQFTRKSSGPIHEGIVIRKGRGAGSEMIHKLLEVPDSSRAARLIASSFNALIILSVLLPIGESIQPPIMPSDGATAAEVAIEVIYLLEFVARLCVSPDRLTFLLAVPNINDMLTVAPLFYRAAIGFTFEIDEDELHVMVLVAVVPVLRMLKLVRRFEKFLLLMRAFELVTEALPVLMYTLFTICLIFSCLIFCVEPRDNIATFPEAMWLTIVTMMTVGYGDTVPVNALGYIAVSLLIITSALYMAMPLGIVGAAFTNTWKQRDCILLVKRTRTAMDQRGYTAFDIPCLFKVFDSDNDGELSRGDFIRMIESMNICLPTERIIDLFDTFDVDGGGSIDAIEFIRQVFPKAFQDIYGDDLLEGTIPGNTGSGPLDDED